MCLHLDAHVSTSVSVLPLVHLSACTWHPDVFFTSLHSRILVKLPLSTVIYLYFIQYPDKESSSSGEIWSRSMNVVIYRDVDPASLEVSKLDNDCK